MKVKFYFSNGFCGCEEEEIVDFPGVTNINDPEIIEYGEEALTNFLESYLDHRFVDYPDEDDFDTEEDYYEACINAEEEYYENGIWECKAIEDDKE